jgi:hypothetical protein
MQMRPVQNEIDLFPTPLYLRYVVIHQRAREGDVCTPQCVPGTSLTLHPALLSPLKNNNPWPSSVPVPMMVNQRCAAPRLLATYSKSVRIYILCPCVAGQVGCSLCYHKPTSSLPIEEVRDMFLEVYTMAFLLFCWGNWVSKIWESSFDDK